MGLKQVIGRQVYESLAHGARLVQRPGLPRLVILPCGPRQLGSSNLRAWQVGRCLRRLGWRVTVIPSQCKLAQRTRIIRWEKPDLILIQKGRHPHNWPRYYPGIPTVFDLDDADFLDRHQAEQIAACCEGSRAVIAGSRYVADWCARHNPNVHVVWTGGLLSGQPVAPSAGRRPVLIWASSDAPGYPEDAALVRSLVTRLADHVPFEFRLHGIRPHWPPEFLATFTSLPVPTRTVPFQPYLQMIASMGEAAVGLNPICLESEYNKGKSFGKVLPYLAARVAVVASNALEMPLFFRHGETGYLAEGLDEWVEHAARLLRDPDLRQAIADRAYDAFLRELTVDAAARKVDRVLRGVLEAV